MRRFDWLYRPLAMMLIAIALASAPVVDLVTHGPGTLAAEADHAAWHAEKG